MDRYDWTSTLDIVNEAFFFGRALSVGHREAFAEQIATNQARSSQANAASTEGWSLFSGERLLTKFATRYILQEEAARALVLLSARTLDIRRTLEQVNARLIETCFAQSCVKGECAHAMIGLMRYLAVGGLDEPERRLCVHLKTLTQQRDGNGQWGHFPFYYTLLALTEINLPQAIEEMRCAAPACERRLQRAVNGDQISQRRRAIMQRVLAAC
jgi:hypothetical protein